MAGCWYAVGLVFLVQLVLQTDCIAPSDRNPTCRTDFRYIVLHNWIPYAEDTSSGTAWKVLVDQYDYESLVGSGMSSAGWSTLDVDGDGKTFAHGSGGTCSFQLKILDTFRTPNSNNWIFTQAIDYIDAVELIVNATIRFTACTQRLNAQPSERCTHDYVILHRYDTNTWSEIQRTTTTNYQPYLNNSESSSRLQQDRNDIRSNTNIISRFRRPINFNYTYLGLRDIGSSGSVVRIFMYYEVCPRKMEGLATYPEVPHPGRLPGASTQTTRLANCAEHSHNTTSLDTYAYQDGRCEQSVTCVCDAGYEQSALQNPPQCVACAAGKYRSTQNVSCTNCPANSSSTMAASEYCTCNEGHYRVTGSEGVGMGCTAPPPRIPECTVSQSFDTAVTIQWTTPADCGGRTDCYYQIKINDGSPKRHSPGFRPNTQETYAINNLLPDTTYLITVSIHNRVSDQDSDNARIRECTIVAKTVQGSVFMLDGVTYLNNTAVLLEDIDANPPLICTTAHTSCCTGNTQGRFFYPDGDPILTQVPASSLLQGLYMIRNRSLISLHLQAGERPPLGTYRCEIPDGRGILQNLYIRIGTAINPQGPNATTDEPTVIIVTAIVCDAIVFNIPDTLNISLRDKIKALIQEASVTDSTRTKPPIIFTAPIMASRSLGQQQIVTIPQENITSIEKGLTYFVKIKPIFVNGSQGDYGLPFFFNGSITRNALASTSTSTEVQCLNLYIFIGVAVGIVMLATIIIVLTCVVCLCKNHERKVVKHHPPMEEQEMEEQEMKEQEMEEQEIEEQEVQVLKTDNCDSKE